MTPFKITTSIIPQKEIKLQVKIFPRENDTVSTKLENLTLAKKIGEGGEGIIYAIKGNASIVCKIYYPEKLTNLRKEKIALMISKTIQFDGICWPIDIVLNKHNEFVGYIMPAVNGKTMQTSMFIKPQILKNFPNFKRRDLVNIAISFLKKIEFLHSMNIIVGDINALNILVEASGKIWFVDTDSYQIENFPCPVGSINFTAPEIQGKDCANFLRTKNHELFAVATMVFMILFPGKPPYSQQGGESQSDNIKKMNFPYWCSEKADVNPPEGSWNFIWSNLSKNLKEHFCMTFKNNQRKEIKEWITVLENYLWSIDKGFNSNELFPTGFPIYDPVQVACAKCTTIHTNSQKSIDKMSKLGKGVFCNNCHKEFRLKKLAKSSLMNKKTIINKEDKNINSSTSTFKNNNSSSVHNLKNLNSNNSIFSSNTVGTGNIGGIRYKNNINNNPSTSTFKNNNSSSAHNLKNLNSNNSISSSNTVSTGNIGGIRYKNNINNNPSTSTFKNNINNNTKHSKNSSKNSANKSKSKFNGARFAVFLFFGILVFTRNPIIAIIIILVGLFISSL